MEYRCLSFTNHFLLLWHFFCFNTQTKFALPFLLQCSTHVPWRMGGWTAGIRFAEGRSAWSHHPDRGPTNLDAGHILSGLWHSCITNQSSFVVVGSLRHTIHSHKLLLFFRMRSRRASMRSTNQMCWSASTRFVCYPFSPSSPPTKSHAPKKTLAVCFQMIKHHLHRHR